MTTPDAAERLTGELWAHWEATPGQSPSLLCEAGDNTGWAQVIAPPVKKKWLTSRDVELLVAEPLDAADSPAWRAAVDRLRDQGWLAEGYQTPLFRAAAEPGRSPALARWAVDELLVALRLGHAVTDVDGLHWV